MPATAVLVTFLISSLLQGSLKQSPRTRLPYFLSLLLFLFLLALSLLSCISLFFFFSLLDILFRLFFCRSPLFPSVKHLLYIPQTKKNLSVSCSCRTFFFSLSIAQALGDYSVFTHTFVFCCFYSYWAFIHSF